MVIRLLDNYRRLSTQLVKIEATKCYLRGVQMVRLSVVGLMLMGLVIGLICVGVLLFHAGLFILLPWSTETKAVLGILLGVGYVAFGCVALHAAIDEKMWMEKSGAADMLKDAIHQSKTD
ncbi:MAG: hypothetical protein A3K19_02725 [Lentisphaerae bacterium RIFOXYB12_FULL_65_16]|nr:MAG: hypothetical protein A3K18_16130 [Lentisphaerae bacterium RIFOXYA12_64_32]OGV92264.1 MAG: hypothetical protein A3K19_02725 [Lentisphaerae bacterium RIFOXYB12_FULL_65_16]